MAIVEGWPRPALVYDDKGYRTADLAFTAGTQTLWPNGVNRIIYGPGIYLFYCYWVASVSITTRQLAWQLDKSSDGAAWSKADPSGTDIYSFRFSIANNEVPFWPVLRYEKTTAAAEYMRILLTFVNSGTMTIHGTAGELENYVRVVKDPPNS